MDLKKKTGKLVIFVAISGKNKNPHIGTAMYGEEHTCTCTYTHLHSHTHALLPSGGEKISLLDFNIKSHFSHVSYVFTPIVWLIYF